MCSNKDQNPNLKKQDLYYLCSGITMHGSIFCPIQIVLEFISNLCFQKRYVLEEAEQLEPRISALEEDMDDVESSEDEEEEDDKV